MKPYTNRFNHTRQIYYKWDSVNCRMKANVYRILRDESGDATCVEITSYESRIMQPDPATHGRPEMWRTGAPKMYIGAAFADELSRVFYSAWMYA